MLPLETKQSGGILLPHSDLQGGMFPGEASRRIQREMELGLEVSADETKYMVMSRDQNAGRNHSVRTDNT